ncbi:hypothetical protein AaE_012391 [Aphanomyces astaci]|uniref:Reverse transcriptase Ty1/copia-type domain-containing protein n=1 Tax=Aphanomyces astaci TaxID=112090 RepID=A0A6A4Z874_APHAT|nr:hypothetical protein AaE_012391 [Aphanomyces astaci]
MAYARHKEFDQLHSHMEVKRDRNNRLMTISQNKYIHDLMEKFGQELIAESNISREQIAAQPYDYRGLIGSLQPDISHAVQRLRRHLHDPREPHMVGAKRVLRYIKATPYVGITYQSKGTDNKATLLGCGDASWADKPDRKSTSGFVWMLLGGPVSWKSSRQKIIALSTCEAEYVAAAEATNEMLWILHDLGQTQDTTILNCDNKAAIGTVQTASTSERSKHIEMRHCGTADMWTDILTKISTKFAMEKFLSDVMAKMKQGDPADST